MTDLNIEQVKAELEAIEARAAEMRAQIKSHRDACRGVKIEEIKEIMVEFGISPIDIGITPISADVKPKRTRKPVEPANYPRYVDPENPDRSYTRGVLPAWFKDAMASKGLDPTVKADRERFKDEHLRREAA